MKTIEDWKKIIYDNPGSHQPAKLILEELSKYDNETKEEILSRALVGYTLVCMGIVRKYTCHRTPAD